MRHWLVTLFAVTGLLPACTHRSLVVPTTLPPRGEESAPVVIPLDATPADTTAAAPPARSPYRQIVTFPPLPSQPAPLETDMERVVYPEAPAMPTAAPLSSQPVPAQLDPRAPLLTVPAVVSVTTIGEDPPLVAALRRLMEKRPEDALALLRSYGHPNQEALLILMPLAVRLAEQDLNRADPADVAAEIDQLQNLVLLLRARSALVVDQMCFCRRIEKFADYEPLPPGYRFRPGDLVQLYVELRNFASEQQEDRSYLTRLASRLEIHDYEGHIVWCRDFPEDRNRPDVSRTLRNDYFNQYRFCVPEIPSGSYTLWLHVTDRAGPKPRTSKRSLDFRVSTVPARE